MIEPLPMDECRSEWEVTQAAAEWLSSACAAPVAAIYLDQLSGGQVLRGLHRQRGAADDLPAQLQWAGGAEWTSRLSGAFRVIPFARGDESGLAVVGPFMVGGPDVARMIDRAVSNLVPHLVSGLRRWRPEVCEPVDLLEAVAAGVGSTLASEGGEVLVQLLRDEMLAREIAWDGDSLVVLGAMRRLPAAEASVRQWLGLLGRVHDPDMRRRISLFALAHLVDSRHSATQGRAERVAGVARRVAEALGLSEEAVNDVETAARLERVGVAMLGTTLTEGTAPPAPGSSRHAVVGTALLRGAGEAGAVIAGVLYQSEAWDGRGGPTGLAGIDIPLEARIVAVASLWADLTAAADLMGDVARQRARRDLQAEAGRRLDPALVGLVLAEDSGGATALAG